MELTYEEKLKLADSQEHLQVVLGNIRTANNQLMGVLNIIEQSSAKVLELQKQEGELGQKIIKDTLEQEKIKENLSTREKRILDEEQKLELETRILSEKNAKVSYEIVEMEKKLTNLSLKHTEVVNSHTKNIDELKNGISILQKETKEHEETKQIQLRDKKSHEDEINRLTTTREEAQKRLMKFLFDAQEEMANITKNIESEKEKIRVPMETLKRETEKLKILQEDLAVIKARLTEQFKLQNPDKQLPIELQTK